MPIRLSRAYQKAQGMHSFTQMVSIRLLISRTRSRESSDSSLLNVAIGQAELWNVAAMKHSDNLMKVSCPKIFLR